MEARPQFVLRLPLPGWAPLVAAWFTAAFFFSLTFKVVALAVVCAGVAVDPRVWLTGSHPRPGRSSVRPHGRVHAARAACAAGPEGLEPPTTGFGDRDSTN